MDDEESASMDWAAAEDGASENWLILGSINGKDTYQISLYPQGVVFYLSPLGELQDKLASQIYSKLERNGGALESDNDPVNLRKAYDAVREYDRIVSSQEYKMILDRMEEGIRRVSQEAFSSLDKLLE